ncbi:MAG: hypothetical protein VW446_01265, partial [Alphaproteobacteria bacterium]
SPGDKAARTHNTGYVSHKSLWQVCVHEGINLRLGNQTFAQLRRRTVIDLPIRAQNLALFEGQGGRRHWECENGNSQKDRIYDLHFANTPLFNSLATAITGGDIKWQRYI